MQNVLQRMRASPLTPKQAQQTAQRYSVIMGTVQSQNATETSEGSNIYKERKAVSLNLPNFTFANTSQWCGAEAPFIDNSTLLALQMM